MPVERRLGRWWWWALGNLALFLAVTCWRWDMALLSTKWGGRFVGVMLLCALMVLWPLLMATRDRVDLWRLRRAMRSRRAR